MIGSTIGPYHVLAKLGEGGMGEVYRARDSKLKREVALKVLPADVAGDRERLARFQREAEVLASLNHPHIAHVYGIEDTALVMELVEGEDLAERLKRGPIPIDEALPIAKQIAEALEAAHDAGIVHRDLKPANIKVRTDGTVKVLDFGLAKALDPGTGIREPGSDLANSPTITSPAMTMRGVILGTAAYMAPEQAKGKPVDKRADIWAFGCVLYEMLTGRRAFDGESVSDVLAAVIRGEPDMKRLDGRAPAHVRRLIDRCLRKDERARLRDIGDARHALDETGNEADGPQALATRWITVAWLGALVVIAAIVAVIGWPRNTPTAPPLRRFAIDLPWHSVSNWTDLGVALSPTGTHIAYSGRRPNENDVEVQVRALDSLESVRLADGRYVSGMTFSPDGEWLALVDGRGLSKVSIHGGQAQELARVAHIDGSQLTWCDDGSVLLGHGTGLLRAPSSGGLAVPLTKIDAAAGDTAHRDPFCLPGSAHAVATIVRGQASELAIVTLADGSYRPLSIRGDRPLVASGQLIFRQGSSVQAAGFDLKMLRATSDAVPILENVSVGPFVAADGSMLYVPARGDANARLVWVDRKGYPLPIPGERLAYTHLALGRGQALLNIGNDIYVRDIERGTRRLLASNGASFPIWSPDGRWATYSTPAGDKAAIVRQAADGSAPAETLITSDQFHVPTSWNARTGELVYFDDASDIWSIKPGGSPARVLSSPANELSGAFSPDGRWLAYVSDETGTFQVYVVPYPGPGPKVAVSIEGGMSPIWSADGRELFFRRGGRVMSAAITSSPALAAGKPVELFDGPYTNDLRGHQRYDVGPDGRFLMVEDSEDLRIVFVQGWIDEVKKVSAKAQGR